MLYKIIAFNINYFKTLLKLSHGRKRRIPTEKAPKARKEHSENHPPNSGRITTFFAEIL